MKARQVVLLSLALLLPIGIFIFLRTFGKNEFNVPPLFQDEISFDKKECDVNYSFPYRVPDSIRQKFMAGDSLVCVVFPKSGSPNSLQRVIEKYENDSVAWRNYDAEAFSYQRQCIFLLREPFDVVLVDREGSIRGQYDSRDREEMDRLITEMAIILRKY